MHERDDFELLASVPPLRDLGPLVQTLEEQYSIRFRRPLSAIRTSLVEAESTIRIWVAAAI